MSSSTATPGLLTSGWVKNSIVMLVVIAVCWGGAIWYWRAAPSAPTSNDLAAGLLALPFGVLLLLWLGKKAALSGNTPVATKAVAPLSSQAEPPIQSLPPYAILTTALRLPHGSSTEELATVIGKNKAQPDVVTELLDDQGIHLMCNCRDDAVDDVLLDEISAWQAQTGMADPHFNQAQWRALSLGTAVMRDLSWNANTKLIDADGSTPQLHLLPVLPSEWSAEQRSTAGKWFEHIVLSAGWPLKNFSCMDILAESSSAALPKLLDQFAAGAASANETLAAIVIACDSNIDQEIVDQWAEKATLFTPLQPDGFVPGEGAAGMLLIGQRQAQFIEGGVYSLADSVQEAPRDASVRKGVPSKFPHDVARRALECSGISLADIGMIVGDASQRDHCMTELMGFAAEATPQLDTTVDVASVGPGCGHCNAVPFIAALALSHHYTLERGKPVLYISNDDFESYRAVVVRPVAVIS